MMTTKSLGFVERLAFALVCCAFGACGSSNGGTGGGPTTGSGGTSTGGSGAGAGTGAGGTVMGTGGTVAGTGGSTGGVSGTGTGGSGAGTGGSGGGTAGAGAGTGGSNGGTGGTASGGSAGGGVAGGTGSGACSAVFCDGFEGSTKLGAAWTVDNSVSANVVEVVSDKAHTGTNSVHMHFTTASGATFIHETMGFPAPMNSLWGRVWLFAMTDPMSTGHDVYIEASDGVPGTMTNHGVRPLNTSGGSMEVNIDPNATGGEDSKSANMPMPRGVWTCFEWQIAATGSTGSVSLFMGGGATPIATVAKTAIPALVMQRVGYEHYNADKAVGDLWIDDFALGTLRINCN